ncbi:hypothetical protein NDK47_27610 (plasmid) [Brevibacillus ruminantium]|uniref:Uncharacterized protein n=1 Tax=Brevibacillus ruminantium TaxID=2950604 RepID=A0ABY4WN29_9BACL|nr:hypothetical protein [Brevibacillus ruminantium]USG68555.1 hypothetical protein NDK47_27610 [Brevibacillus ruminantium]
MEQQQGSKKFEKGKFITLVIAVFFGGLVTIVGAVYAHALLFLVVGFFLGKFLEKALSAIRDYRLSLKLDRVHWSQVEYEAIKKERDALRATLSQQAMNYNTAGVPHRSGGGAPPAVGYPWPTSVDESQYVYRGGDYS